MYGTINRKAKNTLSTLQFQSGKFAHALNGRGLEVHELVLRIYSSHGHVVNFPDLPRIRHFVLNRL